MPCDGPSIEHAYKVGDEITDALIDTLSKQHHITPEGLLFASDRIKQASNFGQLRALIRDIIWTDHAGSF